MAIIRKVGLGLLLAAVVAVFTIAMTELLNYQQWEGLPQHGLQSPDLDEQARVLQDRMEALSGRVAEMQLLVLVLLGTSGLYAIVFVASSYLSSKSFARLADRTIAHMKDEIGIAMGDLRALQEETQRRVGYSPIQRAFPAEPLAERTDPSGVIAGAWESRIANMTQRTAQWQGKDLGEHERLELLRYESEAAYLEVAGGSRLALGVAELYRNFAAIHTAGDPLRARFYLDRALVLAFAEPQLASEIRYHLACWFAAAGDFEQALSSLTAAFQRPSAALDARLATDLEEGGRLYEMASAPPFDKQLNDLLLNVRIP